MMRMRWEQYTSALRTHHRIIIAGGIGTLILATGILFSPFLFSSAQNAISEATHPVPPAPEPLPPPDAYAGLRLTARAAIVVDLSSGTTLFERNANVQLPLASLTKLLTTYAAANTLAPIVPVTITREALAADGDSGFFAGETFAFSDLARFALVASSNDAASAIAEAAAAQRTESTHTLLQAAAVNARLSQTYALNGTGLDLNEVTAGAYGSARDVAKLAAAFLAKAPTIARATTEPSVTIQSTIGIPHTMPNTDIAVTRYPNMLLSKTGFTDLAGGNLAIVFDAGMNHPVAVVVLGSTRDERFTDMDTLVRATLVHFAEQLSSNTFTISYDS